MAKIMIYSAKDTLSLELLSVARTIASSNGAEIMALTINNDDLGQILADAGANVSRVNASDLILADVAAVADVIAQGVQQLGVEVVLLSSDRRGKELAGCLAQIIGAGCITDVSAIQVKDGRIECERNALGGATVATQYIEGDRQVLAIAPKAFPAASGEGGTVTELQVAVKPSGIKVREVRAKDSDSVNIEEAAVIVAVGQGLKSKEDLAMVESLAQSLGGVVACSKPVATDKKWLSEDRVIGLSGKLCKPDLALLFGISGQVQFTVGIRDARTIVAVNTDENATINQMADYILTADMHEIIPELNRLLG
ncbi:MAG TPA: electron transfer flavoprotein subunit alpha/FixB family protein [Syntrophomonadaceae bacterium]|nr:electron transfer flavoprotein subunit alpha/FixB family protein [Syntrophomonadaceae bacterium]HQA08109.1 electron transfer flavoprotein subunit alpha/FixB family protein [Syntrophomonadaceae bacterium]HQE23481.1 electron transfer flavoprotein subunit alpha/FixB family protein [Syntrophomonadaceae bacterium]